MNYILDYGRKMDLTSEEKTSLQLKFEQMRAKKLLEREKKKENEIQKGKEKKQNDANIAEEDMDDDDDDDVDYENKDSSFPTNRQYYRHFVRTQLLALFPKELTNIVEEYTAFGGLFVKMIDLSLESIQQKQKQQQQPQQQPQQQQQKQLLLQQKWASQKWAGEKVVKVMMIHPYTGNIIVGTDNRMIRTYKRTSGKTALPTKSSDDAMHDNVQNCGNSGYECVGSFMGSERAIAYITVLVGGQYVVGSKQRTFYIYAGKHGRLLKICYRNKNSSSDMISGTAEASGSMDNDNCHTKNISCLASLPLGAVASGAEDFDVRIWNNPINYNAGLNASSSMSVDSADSNSSSNIVYFNYNYNYNYNYMMQQRKIRNQLGRPSHPPAQHRIAETHYWTNFVCLRTLSLASIATNSMLGVPCCLLFHAYSNSLLVGDTSRRIKVWDLQNLSLPFASTSTSTLTSTSSSSETVGTSNILRSKCGLEVQILSQHHTGWVTQIVSADPDPILNPVAVDTKTDMEKEKRELSGQIFFSVSEDRSIGVWRVSRHTNLKPDYTSSISSSSNSSSSSSSSSCSSSALSSHITDDTNATSSSSNTRFVFECVFQLNESSVGMQVPDAGEADPKADTGTKSELTINVPTSHTVVDYTYEIHTPREPPPSGERFPHSDTHAEFSLYKIRSLIVLPSSFMNKNFICSRNSLSRKNSVGDYATARDAMGVSKENTNSCRRGSTNNNSSNNFLDIACVCLNGTIGVFRIFVNVNSFTSTSASDPFIMKCVKLNEMNMYKSLQLCQLDSSGVSSLPSLIPQGITAVFLPEGYLYTCGTYTSSNEKEARDSMEEFPDAGQKAVGALWS